MARFKSSIRIYVLTLKAWSLLSGPVATADITPSLPDVDF